MTVRGGLTLGQVREWAVMQADAPAPCACETGEIVRDDDGPVWCLACVAEGGRPCSHAYGQMTCSGPSPFGPVTL